jgi:hypothetical protein
VVLANKIQPAERFKRVPWLLWVLIAVLISYAAIWTHLATPYRLFPSDDRRFWEYMSEPNLGDLRESYEPIVKWSMHTFFGVAKSFGLGSMSAMAGYSIACYLGVMVALALLARRVTTHWPTALLSVLLFAFSAWPVTYMFLFNYAPFMNLVAWVAWALLAWSLLNERTNVFPAIGAAFAALLGLGCSAAGAVSMLGLGVLTLGYVRAPISRRSNLWPGLSFYLTILFGGLLLWLACGKAIHEHVVENANDIHQVFGFVRFGMFFNIPAMTGLWILWTYSKVLTVAFVAASLWALYSFLRGALGKRRPPPDPLRRFVGVLAFALWAEIIFIDIPATTKLGRHEFLWFPGVCLFIALALRWLASLLPANRQWLTPFCVAVILGGSGIEGISRSYDLWRERQALPLELKRHHPDLATLCLLAQDPHAKFFAFWLSDWRIAGIDEGNLVAAAKSDPSREFAIVIGPSGIGSGRSILQNGSLPDFETTVVDSAKANGAIVQVLPYYAFNRPFCLEEAITQGLFYEGRLPDPSKDPSKNLRLIYWPARGAPALGQ